MTVPVKELLLGAPVVDQGGGASLEHVETIDRLVRAIRSLQASPVYASGAGPILTSPNGTQYRLVVDNAGNLTTSAV